MVAKSIDSVEIRQMATELECLLPKLMRRLFTLEPDHPVAELPLAQLRVCTILQSGPRSMSVLSDELGISMSAMTQIADRLERSGLVGRAGELDDRRIKLLLLTDVGEKLMRDRRETRIERAESALSLIEPDNRAEVIRSIRTILRASEALEQSLGKEDPIGIRLEQ